MRPRTTSPKGVKKPSPSATRSRSTPPNGSGKVAPMKLPRSAS
ncbi:MAG: hypothetical protein WKG00_25760 [Polyangiaceae bacterium]